MNKFYIIWCPQSVFPPKQKFTKKETAQKVAKQMEEKYPDCQYHVMELVEPAGDV